jgi:hypothetical protein
MKDKCIEEHVEGSVPLSTITKQHSDILGDMEKLQTIWSEHHNQRRITLNLTTIQKKAECFYAYSCEKKGKILLPS